MPPKTTTQALDELRAMLIEMRETPIMNGGFHELQEAVARIDERQKSMQSLGEQRYGETLVWRADMVKCVDGVKARVDNMGTRLTILETRGVRDALKTFLEKWWIVVVVIIVTIGGAIGVSYPQIVEFISALGGG